MRTRSKKLLLLGILSLALCLSAPVWKASQSSAAESKSTASNPKDDPEYYKYHTDTYNTAKTGGNTGRTLAAENITTFSGGANPYTGGIEFRHNSRYQNYTIYNGIDVSKWQGMINWTKVKADGIDYAFIRCGYSALSDGAHYTDPYFETNMKNASAAGIRIGVYYYSQSKTQKEAEAEARYVLDLIAPYKSYISLPVVYDFETPDSSRAKDLTKTKITANTITFCDIIENAGYHSMYYGSPSKLKSSFDPDKLAKYPCWVANYCYQTTKSFYTKYTGDYLFWQYSDFGKVDGINGNVDMNFYYAESAVNNYVTNGKDKPHRFPVFVPEITGLKQKKNSTKTITLSWKKNTDVTGYQIYRSTSPNGTYKKVKTISSNKTTSWKNSSLSKYRQYYYKIRAYKKENGKTYYSKLSSAVSARTKPYKGRYRRTTARLNVRSYPGTSYSKKVTLAKKKRVKVLYITKANDGSTWYKISWSGKSGYVAGKYLK